MEAVDAASERRFAGSVARFVTAENLRDVSEGLHAADDGLFEETVLQEIAAAESYVVFDTVRMDAYCAVGSFPGGGEARVGHEERAETVPIALAGGAGDYVVERGKEAVDRFHVFRFCSGDARERIRSGLCGSCVLLLCGFFGRGLCGGGIRDYKKGSQDEKCEFHGEFSSANSMHELQSASLDAGTIYQESELRGENWGD